MSGWEAKYERLIEILKSYEPLALAFSGGVDSALLLKAAADSLGPNFLAITVRGPFFPKWEFEEAARLAQTLSAPWLAASHDPLADPKVADNPPDRCYHCKKSIFSLALKEAAQRGFTTLADGSNLDDAADFRPGARAIAELGVVSPLKAAALTKADIRAISRGLELPTASKPAYACLASRIPYGRTITHQMLGQVEEAEEALMAMGFREIRVRHHGEVARIEAGPKEMARFSDETLRLAVDEKMKKAGFPYAALDLAGYRRGSLNETVPPAILDEHRQKP